MTNSETPLVTDTVIDRITTVLGGEVTAQQVNRVLATWNAIREGEPLGTIRRSSDGALAYRVDVDGLHLWKVIGADGSSYNDLQPSLPDWELLADPAGPAS